MARRYGLSEIVRLLGPECKVFAAAVKLIACRKNCVRIALGSGASTH